MKKQMKVMIIAVMIISVYSTMVYAKNSGGTNLPNLVQEIWDQVFLNGEGIDRIESNIDVLSDPVDYSGQLSSLQASVDELETKLESIPPDRKVPNCTSETICE